MAKPPSNEELRRQVIERCWKDDKYRAKLVREPVRVLKQAGYAILDDAIVEVIEEAPNTIYFHIPARPSGAGEITERELEKMAGGIHLANPVDVVEDVASDPAGTTECAFGQLDEGKQTHQH